MKMEAAVGTTRHGKSTPGEDRASAASGDAREFDESL